jgi:sulfur-oxidizing protein SoxB
MSELTGAAIKTLLEDICDNVFNPDPYYQQGGDMVRVGGLQYTCRPEEAIGKRIDNLRVAGKPLDADKRYKVAGWAPVAEGASGKPIWDVVIPYLKDRKVIRPPHSNRPTIVGGG